MEAMVLGYPPEQAGQISVTATKEEWEQVLKDLGHPHVTIGNQSATDEMISGLEGWGIG